MSTLPVPSCLCTLNFTDLSAHIPFPSLSEPVKVETTDYDSIHHEKEYVNNVSLLKFVTGVLGAVDISYLRLNELQTLPRDDDDKLAKALVEIEPSLFTYTINDGQSASRSQEHFIYKSNDVLSHNQHHVIPKQILGASNLNVPAQAPAPKETTDVLDGRKKKRRRPNQENWDSVLNHATPQAMADEVGFVLQSQLNTLNDQGHDVDEEILGDKPQRTFSDPYEALLKARKANLLQLVNAEILVKWLRAQYSVILQAFDKTLSADSDENDQHQVESALDASASCLYIMSAPDMPKEVYIQEVIEKIFEAVKFQLQYNILVFYDARFMRLYRPSLVEESNASIPSDAGKKTPYRTGKVSTSTPKFVPAILGRLEKCMGLLGETLTCTRLDGELLLPLIRVALQTLSMAGLQMLQSKAIVMVSAAFNRYPQQRQHILDELTSGSISSIPANGRIPCTYLVRDSPPLYITPCCATLLAITAAATDLPELKTNPAQLTGLLTAATSCADRFWNSIFDRLPAARANKSDTAVDLKAFVEHIIADLISVRFMPDWPAAELLLRRCVTILHTAKGLSSTDTYVRMAAVDFLGAIARHLCEAAKLAADEAPLVAKLLEASNKEGGSLTDVLERPHVLVLQYLASQASSYHRSAAATFLCCRVMAERAAAGAWEQQPLTAEDAANMVTKYRELGTLKRGDLGLAAATLDDASVLALVRHLANENTLGRGRGTLLKWLADVGANQGESAANVRAKAIKALGSAVEADVRTLSLAEVRAGVRGALADDSVLVREAAVDLVGKYMSTNADLASMYFDMLVRASTDAGVTVRKRAVKIMWECCVRCPGFERATDAVLAVMARGGDAEDAMRQLSARICMELWFTPGAVIDTVSEGASRSITQRARDFCHVCWAVYEALGPSIHLPLSSTVSVVVVLKTILAQDSKFAQEGSRTGAAEMAPCLLDMILRGQDESAEDAGSSGDHMLKCLLALHALCVADASVCMTGPDPARMIRCLGPYLKAPAPNPKMSEEVRRRHTEKLLCILSLCDAFLRNLHSLEEVLAVELAADFESVIGRSAYVQAIAVACKGMCALAQLKPQKVVPKLCSILAMSTRWLQQTSTPKSSGPGTPNPELTAGLLPRYLFAVGQLWRHGAGLFDAQPAAVPDAPAILTVKETMELFLNHHTSPVANMKVKDAALQAMGLLFIPHPQLVFTVPGVRSALEAAMALDAPSTLKLRSLTLLTDLLVAEEEKLMEKQGAAGGGDALPLDSGSTVGLAKRNGEGDDSSFSSGVLQALWPHVLSLAKDVGEAPPLKTCEPSTPSSAYPSGCGIRRKALDLIAVVLRCGLVAPWTAVPALVVLATDPAEETAEKAVSLLGWTAEKYLEFVSSGLAPGVLEVFAFHSRLWNSMSPAKPMSEEYLQWMLQALVRLWRAVILTHKGLKAKFLSTLLRPFEDASSVVAADSSSTNLLQLEFCAQVIAKLPFKKADEPLTILHTINSIIKRRADVVVAKLKEALPAVASETPPAIMKSKSIPVATPTHSAPPTSKPKRSKAHLQPKESVPGPEAAVAPDPQPPQGTMTAALEAAQSLTSPAAVTQPAKAESSAVESIQAPASPSGISSVLVSTPQSTAAAHQEQGVKAEPTDAAPTWPCTTEVGNQTKKLEVSYGACAAVCMLLLLKEFLQQAYKLTDERILAFAPTGPSKKSEEKAMVSCDGSKGLRLDMLKLRQTGPPSPAVARDLLKTIKLLMSEDAANYREHFVSKITAPAVLVSTPSTHEDSKALVVSNSSKPPRGDSRQKRVSNAASTKRKKRSLSARGEEDDDAEEEDVDDEDFVAKPRGKTKRRLETTLRD